MRREPRSGRRLRQVIVGRERELEAIDALMGVNSGAAALLLEGEAGIGKTAVWLEGVSRAQSAAVNAASCRCPSGLPRFGKCGQLAPQLLDRVAELGGVLEAGLPLRAALNRGDVYDARSPEDHPTVVVTRDRAILRLRNVTVVAVTTAFGASYRDSPRAARARARLRRELRQRLHDPERRPDDEARSARARAGAPTERRASRRARARLTQTVAYSGPRGLEQARRLEWAPWQ